MSITIETFMLIGIFLLAICCLFIRPKVERKPRGGTPIGYELPMDYDMNDIRQMRSTGQWSYILQENVREDIRDVPPHFNYADPTGQRGKGGGNPEMDWLMDDYQGYLPASDLRFPRANI